jgi:parallel beta-helix repeat protein
MMKYINQSIRLAILLGVCSLLAACGTAATGVAPTPQPTVPPATPTPLAAQPTPPALAALAARTRPCDVSADSPAAADAGDQPGDPEVADPAVVHYDDGSNTIELRKGANTTLAGISGLIARPDALRELAPGEWLLGANLSVEEGANLRIAAPATQRLKLKSDGDDFVSLKALGGQLAIDGVCVTSWDTRRNSFDEDHTDGRAFILARNGARMDVHGADVRYLGYNGAEAYGLSWRLAGTTGEIVDSFISHNFYGVYSFEVNDLVIRGNEAAYNVMYGIDPHTKSNRLVIENNVAHDNGKHGIILAEECSDGVIRGNVAYNNLHHGIVVYQRSNNNLIENNTTYGNGGHGINVNDSAGTTVRANTVYDNLEAGIGVGQRASATELVDNQVFANRRDGVMLYSDVKDNAIRQNTISDNARYGIYVKSAGAVAIEGNQVTGNRVGVFLNVANPPDVSEANNQIHGNREGEIGRGATQAPDEPEGEQG